MRYELFCRSDVSQDLCLEIAASSVLLGDLLDETPFTVTTGG
jgi:hypothetical protein